MRLMSTKTIREEGDCFRYESRIDKEKRNIDTHRYDEQVNIYPRDNNSFSVSNIEERKKKQHSA